jgi:3-hydroxyisobutyrate dehydrogenase-like beta-hydroxyacid dehydrogenase
MLPDSPDVTNVYLTENGVLGGTREGMLVIDTSTI